MQTIFGIREIIVGRRKMKNEKKESSVVCPECGKVIGDLEAGTCPYCGFIIKKKYSKKIIVVVITIIVLAVIGIVGFKICDYVKTQREYRLEQQEKERQESIKELRNKMDAAYSNASLDEVENYLEELAELGEDISNDRLNLEFDKANIETVSIFYTTLVDVDNKLSSGKYSSLSSLVDRLKTPINNMDQIEISGNSKLALYVDEIRKNIMYQDFDNEYIKKSDVDLDNWLTSSGYAMIISTHTEKILEVEYPFNQNNKEEA